MAKKRLKAKAPAGVEVKALRLLTELTDEIGRMADLVETPQDARRLAAQLKAYAKEIGPWADRKAIELINDVNRRDRARWNSYMADAGGFSRALRKNVLDGGEIGETVRGMQREAAKLIKSLPTEAAQRVTHLAAEYQTGGLRPAAFIEEIKKSGQVSHSRAKMIARTEISRASTTLTEARAESAGSPGYIWVSSVDGRVRDSHLSMNGEYVPWSQPPTLDDLTGHAGALPNCRCYPKVVFEEPNK